MRSTTPAARLFFGCLILFFSRSSFAAGKDDKVSKSPDGEMQISVHQYKDDGDQATDVYLQRGRGGRQAIALPDTISLTQARAPHLDLHWSADSRIAVVRVAWEHSDELLFCEVGKKPLRFNQLPDPDWSHLLSGDESQAFGYFIDQVSFVGPTQLQVTYRAEMESGTKTRTFLIDLGGKAVTLKMIPPHGK